MKLAERQMELAAIGSNHYHRFTLRKDQQSFICPDSTSWGFGPSFQRKGPGANKTLFVNLAGIEESKAHEPSGRDLRLLYKCLRDYV